MNSSQLSRRQKYFHRKRAYILSKLGGSCEKCGAIEKLEIHHKDNVIRGRSRGRQERTKDYLQNLDNGSLEILCFNCHKQHHRRLKEND